MIDVDVDASKLWGLCSAMSYRDRMRSMKRAFAAGANRIKRRAGEILVSELGEVRDPKAMKKTVWTKVYSRVGGFRVTVAGNTHPYPAKQRRLPLGRWMEEGTDGRDTKSRGPRGKLGAVKFLAKANDELKGSVSANLEKDFMEQLTKTARKYGCI